MRAGPVAVLLLLAGCAAAPPLPVGTVCPEGAPDLAGPIEETRGTAFLVNATGRVDGPVVVHVRANTTLLARTGATCAPADLSDFAAGAWVDVEAKGAIVPLEPPQVIATVMVVRIPGGNASPGAGTPDDARFFR